MNEEKFPIGKISGAEKGNLLFTRLAGLAFLVVPLCRGFEEANADLGDWWNLLVHDPFFVFGILLGLLTALARIALYLGKLKKKCDFIIIADVFAAAFAITLALRMICLTWFMGSTENSSVPKTNEFYFLAGSIAVLWMAGYSLNKSFDKDKPSATTGT